MARCAHSCVEKAGMISLVKMRELDTDENHSLRGGRLQRAIDEDRRMGLFPFYVCATLGTTACCSFDNLFELGLVAERESIWLHVDAAYAGSALICPEMQYLIKGIDHANSFNMNPTKWLLVNFDCSAFWVRDQKALTNALTVDPLYLQHRHSDKAVDFRHWGIPLSRRFRSLKLWFVIRSYGVEGLQKYVREHIRLAKKFEKLVQNDDRFETVGKAVMGLVCFRLKGSNYRTQTLLRAINMSGKLHMVPALVQELYVIRFAVNAQNAIDDDISFAWNVIAEMAQEVIVACESNKESEGEFERIASLELSDEELDEFNDVHNGEMTTYELSPISQDNDADDEVFLYDSNIPSIPSLPTRYGGSTSERNGINPIRRRNLLLRMISDPKCYNPRVLKSLTRHQKRPDSESSTKEELANETEETEKPPTSC